MTTNLTQAVPASGGFDDQLATRLLHQRIVVLGADVDDPIANRACAQLLLLSAEDKRADISLYINSPGGSVTAGLAIYDTMRMIPNDVSTLAMGFAASMGQFLLCSGKAGKRFALQGELRVIGARAGAGGGRRVAGTVASRRIPTAERLSGWPTDATAPSVDLLDAGCQCVETKNQY